MNHRLARWALAASALLLALAARAAFSVPGYELVYSYPIETSLEEPDLRQAREVWPEMFDAAKRSIDIEQFYVTPSTQAPMDAALEPSLRSLERAGRRGVRIRVLLERKFARVSRTGAERLRAIPHLELRFIEWARAAGAGKGIVHAKFFVVDSSRAFVGSQNLDWRALDQIHELGLAISDLPVARQVQAVFDKDWALALARAGKVPELPKRPAFDRSRRAYLVASPWRFNPASVGDSESELARLIGRSRRELLIQNYDYLPLGFGRGAAPYPLIDDALRGALARGVKVKLLLDRLDEDRRHLRFLKPLARLSGCEVRFLEIPRARRGPIPYARVAHSKYMVVDGSVLWLGTSNWAGGYLDDSRNLELVVRDKALARRAAALWRHLWDSSYAAALTGRPPGPPGP